MTNVTLAVGDLVTHKTVPERSPIRQRHGAGVVLCVLPMRFGANFEVLWSDGRCVMSGSYLVRVTA